jgi:tetratricopeptide (TPR) repeat protein
MNTRLGVVLAVLTGWGATITQAGNTSDPPPEVNGALRRSQDSLATTNLASPAEANVRSETVAKWQAQLDQARRENQQKNPSQAAKTLESVLQENPTDEIRRTGLLELALMAQAQGQFAKAQRILTQYVQTYPRDSSVPEVLLRQGLLYREMGTLDMALAKFYSVMTVVLHLELNRMEYYQRLVLQAQTEIADTYCAQERYAEASACYRRLLKLDSPVLKKSQIHLKLMRSLSRQAAHSEVATEADKFLRSKIEPLQEAETRLLWASSLLRLGRKAEAREQLFLQLASLGELQQADTNTLTSAVVAQRQQQAGNEFANQLYSDGDYKNALALYVSLAQSNPSLEWQLSALYQTALVYERLGQLDQARKSYEQVVEKCRGNRLPLDDTSKFLLEMTERRLKMVAWLIQAANIVSANQPQVATRSAAPVP